MTHRTTMYTTHRLTHRIRDWDVSDTDCAKDVACFCGDINELDYHETSMTPLTATLWRGKPQTLLALAKRGDVDPQAYTGGGLYPLTVAAQSSNGMVAALLKAFPHVEINQTSVFGDRSPPLVWAAIVGSCTDVACLLDHGADPTIRNRHGRTARDAARQTENFRIAEMLRETETWWTGQRRAWMTACITKTTQ